MLAKTRRKFSRSDYRIFPPSTVKCDKWFCFCFTCCRLVRNDLQCFRDFPENEKLRNNFLSFLARLPRFIDYRNNYQFCNLQCMERWKLNKKNFRPKCIQFLVQCPSIVWLFMHFIAKVIRVVKTSTQTLKTIKLSSEPSKNLTNWSSYSSWFLLPTHHKRIKQTRCATFAHFSPIYFLILLGIKIAKL